MTRHGTRVAARFSRFPGSWAFSSSGSRGRWGGGTVLVPFVASNDALGTRREYVLRNSEFPKQQYGPAAENTQWVEATCSVPPPEIL